MRPAPGYPCHPLAHCLHCPHPSEEPQTIPPRTDQKAGLGQVPWLTAEGYIDISRLPIDGVLRRVKGTSATRAYLRRLIDTLASFPAEPAEDQVLALSTVPQVGPRFRERLQDIAFGLR